MQRYTAQPRADWEKTVQSQGLLYHKLADGTPYWNESAYYAFTASEVDRLEAATNELHEMCLKAVQHVIDKDLFDKLHIHADAAELIRQTWEAEPPAIYGRFDLAFDGSDIKMLEYNADTPTSLIESAVIQWYWKETVFPQADQFNSIHERLIAKWKELIDYCSSPLYLGYISEPTGEDYMTVAYMADTASQAGHQVKLIEMKDIGFHYEEGHFVDQNLLPIKSVFKLYPWEWLIHEAFGKHLLETREKTDWIEPAWKMVLSNKGILPILWELYPGHPYLLPTYFEENSKGFVGGYVRKPLLSREGQNVTVFSGSGMRITSKEGEYGEEGYILQQQAALARFDDRFSIIGSWVIDGESAGMGIRESKSLITDNTSCFVPHIFQ